MNLAVAQKPGAFQPGDQTQYTRLLAKFQVILESDQVVRIGAEIFLPQLHRSIRNSAGARVLESDWLHRAETQRVASAPGDFFDGQAAFKVVQVFPAFLLNRLCREKCIVEPIVFFFRHWTIDVVGRPFVVAGRQVHLAHIDGIGFDDGADRIVKIKIVWWRGFAPRRIEIKFFRCSGSRT